MDALADRHLFLAFSTWTGTKEEFDAWYDGQHVPEVLGAPGMRGAQRFLLAETKPLPGSKALDYGHLAVYDLEGDPTPFREEIKRMMMSGDMVLPDFLNQPFTTLILRPVSEPFTTERFDAADDLDDRHLFFAWSRHSGEDEPFERWYDEEHIAQIMGATGMLRAQRFEPAAVKPVPGVETPDLGHLAIYEVEGDMGAFREEVKEMLMSGAMVLPEFMIPPFETMFLRPVSPYFASAEG
jgi:hypothetical protein